MSDASFSPKFIKAEMTFTMDQQTYSTGEQLINASGVPGFTWTDFDPQTTIGRIIEVQAKLLIAASSEIKLRAMLTCEKTEERMFLGMTFLIGEKEKATINQAVAAEGILPEFIRKYPRIPFSEHIAIMPSHAVVRFFIGDEDVTTACTIDDFSPSGFQVSCDDPRCVQAKLGSTMRVLIQPRGRFAHAINLNATPKRLIYKVDPKTGNLKVHFGMNITMLSAENKAHFADLLRQIVLFVRNQKHAA